MPQIIKRDRLSLDIDPEEHRRIKAFAALNGKSIKEFILECVRKDLRQAEEDFFMKCLTTKPCAGLEELWDNNEDSIYDNL